MSDARLKSFIDRVIRLKEEQDTIAADIREVYAEAKGEGYDKTAMGQVVAYLRKVEKVGVSAVEERRTIFDLYLEAYERPSHAHTCEATPAKGKANDGNSKQHVGRTDDEQRNAARVSSTDGRRESADESDQGQGAGASGTDRGGGPVSGTLDSQDEDGRSGHVGREARHEITIPNSLPSPPEANTTGEGVSSPASPVTVSVLHSPEVAGGRPYPSSDEAPAGQHGMFGQSEHQTASAAQGRNEPASASGASATPSAMTARTQVELIRLLRPNCAHADDLEKCGGQGSKHCHACQTAAREVTA